MHVEFLNYFQGSIVYEDGDFYLYNSGRRPFYVNGAPLITGCKCKIFHNYVIEVSESTCA